jgi:threonine/homoserine/homoserine lactone efflux protein
MHDLLGLITITSLGVLSPGPNLALVIKSSLTRGYTYAMFTTFGIITSLSIQIFLCIMGLDLVIKKYPDLFYITRILGGIYLIYLSFVSFKHALFLKKQDDKNIILKLLPQKELNKSFINDFSEGFICNTLDFNVALFILFLFSTIITPNLALAIKGLYGATAILTTLICLWLISFLISQPAFKQLLAKSQFQIHLAFGIILAIFGMFVVRYK